MAALVSNTVQVKLPQGLDLQSTTDSLKRFGAVSHVAFTDVSNLSLSVVFFDVRAADAARKALGEKCCRAGSQTGIRTVCVPASAQLGIDSIRGVSTVKPDPNDSSSLILEFFDTRDAQRVQDLIDQKPSTTLEAPTLSAPPGLASAKLPNKQILMAPPGLAPAGLEPPPGLFLPNVSKELPDSKVIQPPSECPPTAPPLQAPTGDQVEVLIKNLPERLCSDAALMAMLEQADIERLVVSYEVRLGEAHLWLKNRKAGKKCVKHFDGRIWEPTGSSSTTATPVEAKLVTLAGDKSDNTEKQHKSKPSQRTKAANAKRQVPIVSRQGADKSQLHEAMAHFFSSPAGQKLLSAEVAKGVVAKSLPPKDVANINWDDFEDWSEEEQ